MHRSTFLFVLILVIFTAVLGYNYFFEPFAYLSVQQEDSATQEAPSLSEEEVTAQLIAQQLESMSVEEKIAQLFMVPIQIQVDVAQTQVQASRSAQTVQASQSAQATQSAEVSTQVEVDEYGLPLDMYDWFRSFKPGGILLFGTKLDFLVTQEVVAKLQATQDKSLLIGVDHEGGTVQRLSGSGFTVLPSWKEQCAQPLEDIQVLWKKSAKELKDAGVSVVFAPVVDFALNHPSLKTRVCSDDLEKVIVYAQEYYQSFLDVGVQPVFKHFPGIGKTKVDLHDAFESVTVGADEAKVYQTLADNVVAGQFAVMTSHVGVRNQFETIPCSQSEACVQEIYAVAPNALVFSDALEMQAALQVNNSILEASRLAIQAGNSYLVYGPSVTIQEIDEIHEYLVTQYSENTLFRAKVDSAVRRNLDFKQAQSR